MRPQDFRTAALVAVAVAAAACAKQDTHASPTKTAQSPTPPAAAPRSTTPTPPAPIEAPAPIEVEDIFLLDEDVVLPTQAEADLDAAQSIDEANADAELEKLKQELGGG